MTRYVIVRFTPKEAAALLWATHNTMAHPDALESSFPDGREQAAAVRACDKLRDAIEEDRCRDA